VRVVHSGGFTDATLEWPSAKGKVEVSLADGDEPTSFLTSGQPISVTCSTIDAFEKPILLRQCEGLMVLDRD
jgi:hypothetical protein